MMLIDTDTGMISAETLFFYNFDIEKYFHLYYNIKESNTDKKDKIIRWGTILYTTDISSIDEIMEEDFMPKEDKEKFIKVSEELQEKHKTFTDEEIIQLTEWKMEGERLGARETGLAEGHAEGRAEALEEKTIEYVTKMLDKNYSFKEISEITGLTEEEIIKIQNK